jgi:hypothetical protein
VSLLDDMLDGLIGFGRVVSTRLGGAKTVTGKVSGDGGESPDAVEFWGPAGVQSRPPAGAEVLFIRRGDELVGVAFKSRQWQVDVVDGEVAVHALGQSGATQAVLRLQPDGTAVLDGVSIKLGATATQLVALASKVDAAINAIVGTVIVPNDGGAAIKLAVSTAWTGVGSSSAATKTKAV